MSTPVCGLLHLYTGDGKGKTTAAVGLAVRALGCGKRVLFCQFLKSGASGEVASLELLGARVLHAKTSPKFLSQMTETERAETHAQHLACWRDMRQQVMDGAVDVLILDEAVDAVNCGLLPLSELLDFIQQRPAAVEIILTGRNPAPALCELADYHTDFRCIRHPYSSGIAARRGIEY